HGRSPPPLDEGRDSGNSVVLDVAQLVPQDAAEAVGAGPGCDRGEPERVGAPAGISEDAKRRGEAGEEVGARRVGEDAGKAPRLQPEGRQRVEREGDPGAEI